MRLEAYLDNLPRNRGYSLDVLGSGSNWALFGLSRVDENDNEVVVSA